MQELTTNCANQLRSSRTEYDSDMNPNICQFVAIRGIRGLCGIGVYGMDYGNHAKSLECQNADKNVPPLRPKRRTFKAHFRCLKKQQQLLGATSIV